VTDSDRPGLRVRRYVDGELEATYRLERGHRLDIGDGAALDAEWCALQVERGRRFRIVIDDPDGELGLVVVLHGGPDGEAGGYVLDGRSP